MNFSDTVTGVHSQFPSWLRHAGIDVAVQNGHVIVRSAWAVIRIHVQQSGGGFDLRLMTGVAGLREDAVTRVRSLRLSPGLRAIVAITRNSTSATLVTAAFAGEGLLTQNVALEAMARFADILVADDLDETGHQPTVAPKLAA